ncbi:MAG TPA: hypothetical protein RMG45_03320, partial [Polyangiaceae bacterium LLY-WYZ-15_(1-7)]|nr:hypothetical protein [Polyangiaceae bacterium LLY-WYZ-15_(1-7)]
MNLPGWGAQPNRAFLGIAFDLGFIYLRPRLSVGWGKPFARWFGVDVNPIVSPRAAGGYGGLRVDVPHFNFRAGVRLGVSYNQSYLPKQHTYDTRDWAVRNGTDQRYFSWEAELTLDYPLGPGEITSETAVTYITGVEAGFNVYEEHIKVIVDPPWVWRTRLGYELRFGAEDTIRLGVVAELLGVPQRDLVSFRAGLTLRVRVTPQLEIRAAWIPPLYLRDNLGIRGGDFALLGLRYRWASGMPEVERPLLPDDFGRRRRPDTGPEVERRRFTDPDVLPTPEEAPDAEGEDAASDGERSGEDGADGAGDGEHSGEDGAGERSGEGADERPA